MTHCDLAETSQPHRERGGHEVFEGQVQALFVETQCAVQRLLHSAPHQISHIACGALSQFLVRQLTQISEDSNPNFSLLSKRLPTDMVSTINIKISEQLNDWVSYRDNAQLWYFLFPPERIDKTIGNILFASY